MYYIFLFASLLVINAFAVSNSERQPFLSDEFINKINQKQSLWQAGRNFHENVSLEDINSLLGTFLQTSNLPVKGGIRSRLLLPSKFDARQQWKDCPSVREIRDQSTCGGCWAFAATEAMSDRICIHSNGKRKVALSAADLISCCDICGLGCHGGDPAAAWRYWVDHGIVSGGAYGSHVGCKPYFFPPCEHYKNGTRPTCGPYKNTPECKRTCDNTSNIVYEDDLSYGTKAYTVIGEENIQNEILQNGPVEAAFIVYADFLSYKNGIYKHVEGQRLGGHAVKIIGWGVEDSVYYWLVANSWNEDWGENGYFKILRGSNECGIETYIAAGLPRL